MSFQTEKDLVRAHHAVLVQATPATVADAFWRPFLTAMSRVQRREDVVFAGRTQIDGFAAVWVVSMGHLMGMFDAAFLGIRPARRIAMLRYAEFHRVEGGRIVETAFFCDLLHLTRQAGQYPPAAANRRAAGAAGPRDP